MLISVLHIYAVISCKNYGIWTKNF